VGWDGDGDGDGLGAACVEVQVSTSAPFPTTPVRVRWTKEGSIESKKHEDRRTKNQQIETEQIEIKNNQAIKQTFNGRTALSFTLYLPRFTVHFTSFHDSCHSIL
jgi:hypothetical protein